MLRHSIIHNTAAWLLCRGRKAQQRWTDEEVELLIKAREVLGNNTQWAVEALSRWDFRGRENIHLHDKWKNMVRSVKEQKTTRGVRLTQEQCDRIQQVRKQFQGFSIQPMPSLFYSL